MPRKAKASGRAAITRKQLDALAKRTPERETYGWHVKHCKGCPDCDRIRRFGERLQARVAQFDLMASAFTRKADELTADYTAAIRTFWPEYDIDRDGWVRLGVIEELPWPVFRTVVRNITRGDATLRSARRGGEARRKVDPRAVLNYWAELRVANPNWTDGALDKETAKHFGCADGSGRNIRRIRSAK